MLETVYIHIFLNQILVTESHIIYRYIVYVKPTKNYKKYNTDKMLIKCFINLYFQYM